MRLADLPNFLTEEEEDEKKYDNNNARQREEEGEQNKGNKILLREKHLDRKIGKEKQNGRKRKGRWRRK